MTNASAIFLRKIGSGTHSDPKFGRRWWVLVISTPGKEGSRTPFRLESFSERTSGTAFRPWLTPSLSDRIATAVQFFFSLPQNFSNMWHEIFPFSLDTGPLVPLYVIICLAWRALSHVLGVTVICSSFFHWCS
jgi:hypothetical protein